MRLILLLQLIFLGKSQLNNVHYAFSYSETHETEAEHISVGVDITNLNQSSVLYRFVLLTWTSRLTYFVDGENCLTETEPCDRLLFINRTFVNVTVHQGGKILDIITFQHQENGQLPKVFVLGCGQDISSRHCVHAIRETFAIPSNREEICVCQYTFPQCSDECFTQDACIDGKPWWHTPANQIGYSSVKGDQNDLCPVEPMRRTSSAFQTTTPISEASTSTISSSSSAKSSKILTTSPVITKVPTSRVVSTETSTVTTMATVSPPTFPSLKNLSDSGVGLNNVSTILNETLKYSSQGVNLNSTEIYQITNILEKSANLPGISSENSYVIVENMDNILYAMQDEIRASSDSHKRLLSMLPTMVENTADERIEYLEGVNLGFSSKRLNCSVEEVQRDDGIMDLGPMFKLINTSTSYTKLNSIVIPLSDLCRTQQISHTFFTIYRDRKLFLGPQRFRSYSKSQSPISERAPPSSNSLWAENFYDDDYDPMDAPSSCVQQTLLTEDSPVMSATVLNNGQQIHAASTEETMAVLRFDISKLQNPLHGTFRVTWWDIEKETWAVNQPCTIISVKDGILEARCIHLTDFTLIVDGAVDDPIVCDSALEGVGLATNLISIISLVFLCAVSLGAYTHTMTRTSFYRYVNGNSLPKQDVVATVYHFDLLLFYLLFAFFSNESIAGRACDEMAAITYALLVCSLFLTVFQGIRTILPFVPIFFRPFFNAFLAPPAVISVSLTLPFMLSLFLLVFTNFFDRDDSFCWVRPDYVVYAIVVPVSILVLNGIMCTMFLVYKVFLNKTRKFSRVLNHQHDPQMKSKIIGMIFMQISLGMPWVLQYFTIYWPYTTAWHYLFTIIVGSQGTMHFFVFFYLRSRRIQEKKHHVSRVTIENSSKKEMTTKEEIPKSEIFLNTKNN